MNRFIQSAVLTTPSLTETNSTFLESCIPLNENLDINSLQLNNHDMTSQEIVLPTYQIENNINDMEQISSTTSGTPKKQRIMRYCPKEKDIVLSLECEFDDCKKLFNSMDHFLDHIDNHLNDYLSIKFVQEVEKNLEDEEKTFECKWYECDSELFDCESTYKRHVRFHAFHTKLKQIGQSVLNNNDSKEIPKCKCNLDDQTRNAIPLLPYKFECSYDSCQYKTDNPELFYRHIRNQHVSVYPSKLKNAKCKWSNCEQIITNRNRFVEHLRHHSQEKLVACPNCGALFASFTKFIDHCNRSGEIGNLCYQCSHCNKKFSTNNLLKEHIRKHVNKFKCPICDMTCIGKTELSKHILYKHTTQKSFKCSYCEHICKTQLDLQKHISLKHSESYEYQCNECDFKSKDLNIIKKHMLKSHMNVESSSSLSDGQSGGTYMCHVCNKTYSQAATLSRHLKSVHKVSFNSGHSRFRYKLESDGYYRLQTLRYESLELVQQLNKDAGIVNNEIDKANSSETLDYAILNEAESVVSYANIIQADTIEAQYSDDGNKGDQQIILLENNEHLNNEPNNQLIIINESNHHRFQDAYSTILATNKSFNNGSNNTPNKNSRIDFDMQNFFLNSNIHTANNSNNLNNETNNLQFEMNNSNAGAESNFKAYFIERLSNANSSQIAHTDYQNSNFSLHTNQ